MAAPGAVRPASACCRMGTRSCATAATGWARSSPPAPPSRRRPGRGRRGLEPDRHPGDRQRQSLRSQLDRCQTDGHHGFVHIKQHSSTVTYTPHPNYCNTRPGRPRTRSLHHRRRRDARSRSRRLRGRPAGRHPRTRPLYVENDARRASTAVSRCSSPTARATKRDPLDHVGYVAGQDHLLWHDNDPTDAITLDPSSTDATIKLVGTGRPTRWRTALRAVRYENSSDTPNTSPRTVTISVTTRPGRRTPGPPLCSSPLRRSADRGRRHRHRRAELIRDDDRRSRQRHRSGRRPDHDHGRRRRCSRRGRDRKLEHRPPYAPTGGYCNTHAGDQPDSFTYKLNGGATATVRVTVTCSDAAETPSGSGRRRRREAARRRPVAASRRPTRRPSARRQ